MRIHAVFALLLFAASIEAFTLNNPILLARSPTLKVMNRRSATSRSMPVVTMSSEWSSAVDQASGREYWYNSETLETTWSNPNIAQESTGPAPVSGPRLGRLGPIPKGQEKWAYKGGAQGLKDMMNPLRPGVNPWQQPSLMALLGFKLFVIGWAIFVGFHNKYAGDFGPFITFHDNQVDFGQASREWTRLHAPPSAPPSGVIPAVTPSDISK